MNLFKKLLLAAAIAFSCITGMQAQISWVRVDSLFQPLPASVHVYKTMDPLDGKPNIAYYVIADLKDKNLLFDTDTTLNRRLTPAGFYERNQQPLVVVNSTFFSFATNQNLNLVIGKGRLLGYNIHSIPGRGKDTLTYRHVFGSALGISKQRKADIAWIFTDSSLRFPYATQWPVDFVKDSNDHIAFQLFRHQSSLWTKIHKGGTTPFFHKWKMQAAVGGGPVLIQNSEIKITNSEELKFAGKAINDKHPRTALGYTKDKKLIILVVQGRFSGEAEGADLTQLAQIMKDLGCHEALNLDGGGSSCLLVNGKETIKPSDASGQRPVPAVFMITSKK